MNWIASLQDLYRSFPAPAGHFRWVSVEKKIQKTLGLSGVAFDFRDGETLALDDVKKHFTELERAGLLERLDRKRGPWFPSGKRKGKWSCFWPLGDGGKGSGFLALGWKKNRLGFTGEEKKYIELAADRASLCLENRRLWKVLETTDRQAALGYLSLTIAHEIRNPLAAMDTLVQLLPAKRDAAGFLEGFQKVMIREITHLTLLTDDFLDYAKGGRDPRETVDFTGLVFHVVQLLKPYFKMKQTRLRVQSAGNLYLKNGDNHRLQGLIMNLLLNAAQSAGPGGTVWISSSRHIPKAGGQWIKLAVRDSGSGVPREYRDRIFNPYFSAKNGGSGLGLAICRKTVLDHQGFIKVKGRSRKGAEFTVLLPVVRPQ